MCGIVGVNGLNNATSVLVNGLKKLEYRGYDSAGIYVNEQNGKDHLVKAQGKIINLENKITDNVQGSVGIGHTRWATHGIPSVENAHPHFSQDDRFYLVHNGVIENYLELKETYLKGVHFESETDTEVVVQLIDKFSNDGLSTPDAFHKTISLLKNSSYAFILMDREQPDILYVAKNKSPLLIGLGSDFNVVCSDALAMLDVTDLFLELHDKEVVTVTKNDVKIENENGEQITREPFKVNIDPAAADKGAYPYYMLKEIDEQPAVMRRIQGKYLDNNEPKFDAKLIKQLTDATKLYIVGAGTSYHAGLVGKKLFEKLAKTPTEVVVASEFAYDDPIIEDGAMFIFLSQSGETADSRQVLVRATNEWKVPTLTITNVDNSTLAREADNAVTLEAGPEIAVASTKAYTAQIAVEVLLATAVGRIKDITAAKEIDLNEQFSQTANAMQVVVDEKDQIQKIAEDNLAKTRNAFYIGRGLDYNVALEASLKLKEISYIQAEGFAAGELKHGTIALIEKGTPVIGIITQAATADNTRSNLQEVLSRGANVINIVREGLAKDGDQIIIPSVDEIMMPLVSVVVGQLMAYYATLLRGYNVDQPRNLAKSVTVE
ncbi:glutamine--fructose-6-phosphate transaminase (isomerizing) [Pediococcus argentinicus]|uniref:Glutamine--fructose-6-phosphate aminotransferase [isomerizing] n=1 Tax=Pediococcus argentinicus TaxID=480391 RepID=A0A0R2NKH5_9LACO|nr:glutamine--fructose-6-phosphate transaminase (isomerizing) [Pediococcus argentinicus]KRO25836.1 glucosamine--fructose-6-phosphate aminotransferase [Pediococcus argentinicus]NKZ21829.1 glutamine--fructose-6-phosphate transaminase (isomerizing) [Pediococcus argentinicus]GEP18999.1 glutamine--fructose-6-phosphate aminotransferase [isomerizing] [Pediococcus argentinicus]